MIALVVLVYAAGATTIGNISGTVELTVVKTGFAPATASLQVAPGTTQVIIVELQPQPTVEETVTVVASTRTDRRLEDQPMRVEVLAREEIEDTGDTVTSYWANAPGTANV